MASISQLPTSQTSRQFNNLDGNNGFSISGFEDATGQEEGQEEALEETIDIAGDINADGIDDIIIGVPGTDANGGEGKAYVLFGAADFEEDLSLESLDGRNGFAVSGNGVGKLVSRAGDINGDDIDDFLIGGDREVAVVFGSATGFNASLALSELDGSNGFTLSADANIASISEARDINGDGIGDIIIGAPTGSSGSLGKSYVVFGSRSPFAANVGLSNLDGSNGFVISGSSTDVDGFGQAVSTAGDINNDGIDDILIGAPDTGENIPSSVFGARGPGASYVVFGRTDGFSASLSVSELNGSNGFAIETGLTAGELGTAVSNAEDVNGDGIDDIIIGAPKTLRGRGSFTPPGIGGTGFVLFGKETGFESSVNLSDFGNSARILARFGELGSSVGNAGDVNNDGFSDIVISSSSSSSRNIESYVFFGSSAGFSPDVFRPSDTDISLSETNGTNGFRLPDTTTSPAAGGGDVNGDGIDDVVTSRYVFFGKGDDSIDAPFIGETLLSSVFFNASDKSAGTLYVNDEGVIVGRLAQQAGEQYQGSLISNTDDTTSADDIIIGTDGSDYIFSGNQGSDIIDAGAGDDFVYFSDRSSGATNFTDLGSGDDTFYMQGGDPQSTQVIFGSGNNTIGVGNQGAIRTGDGDDFVYSAKDEGVQYTPRLGNGNNSVWIQQGRVDIETGSGDDVIGLGRVSGTVNAGDGNNIIYAISSEGVDDRSLDIVTGSGNDYIQSGRRDDILDGGTGFNVLLGGAGRDTFVVRTAAYNYLEDFETGLDTIRLADISFGELSFYQGTAEDGNEANAFIFAGDTGFVEVANTTVSELNNAANFA